MKLFATSALHARLLYPTWSFHHSACKRRQTITDQSSITPSSTAPAPSPTSSAAFCSQRSQQNHPSANSLPRQIPIDGQLLAAVPRVPSSEAFGRRPSASPKPTARAGPPSETPYRTVGLLLLIGSREHSIARVRYILMTRRSGTELDFAQGQRQRHGGERDQRQQPKRVHIAEVRGLRLQLLSDPLDGLLMRLHQ